MRGLIVVVIALSASVVLSDTWIWAEPSNYTPQPRFEHTASRVGSKLVVFGGTLSNDVKEKDIHILDIDSKTWKTPKVPGFKPGPTSGHAAVAWQENLYVLFGTDGYSMNNRIYSFNPSSNVWMRVVSNGRIPSPRAYHSAVVADGHVYTFGGFDGRFYLNDLHKWEIFDPATNSTGSWVKLDQTGAVPDVRAAAATALYGRQLYVFGGFEVAVYRNDFFVLNLDTYKWSAVALNRERSCAMPGPRAMASLTLVGDRLVLFGGIFCASNGSCSHLNDIHQFNIHKSEFSSTQPEGTAPPARYGHSATLAGTKILIFGGSAYPTLFNDMFQYEVYENQWSVAEGIPPYARKQHTLNQFVDPTDNRTKLVVFGGRHGSGGFSNHLHFFDLETSRWSHGPTDGFQPPPMGNHASSMSDNDTMVVFGGYNGTHSSNDVYSVDLPFGTWEKVDADGYAPPPCHGMTVVKTNSEWLLFGGVDCVNDNCTFFNDIFALNFESLSWSRIEVNGSVPRPRASHTMTAVSDVAFLMFGGIGSYFSNLNDLYVYSHVDAVWGFVDSVGAKPEPRFGHTAQNYGGKLLVFGGANCKGIGDCTYFSDVSMFIPPTRVWIKVTVAGSYPSGRAGAASLMIGERLFIHGGGAQEKFFSELLVVEPDKTVPEKTLVLGRGVTAGDAGTPTIFFVQPQDSFSVNRTTGGDEVKVTVMPTSHLAIAKLEGRRIKLNVRDESNGQYQARFTTKVMDVYNVSVSVNGVESVKFQTTIHAGVVNSTLSFAKGDGLSRCVAGEDCSFDVELFDSYGNKLDRKEVIDTMFAGPRRVLKKVRDPGTGKQHVSYTPEKSGNYSIYVFVRGSNISGSPFSLFVSPSAPMPSRSRLWGEGLQGSRAGVPGTLALAVFDTYDNPILKGGDEVKAHLIGPDDLACAVEDLGNGTYAISYTAVKIGMYRLNIVLNDEEVQGSPYAVKITNAPISPTTTFAYGAGLRYAIAGYQAFFTIQSADDFGNNMTTGGAQFNVLFAGMGDSKQICNVTDHGDGKYTVSYLTTASSEFMISATLWNSEIGYQSIHNSPFMGYSVAAGADPIKSFLYLESVDKPLTDSQIPFRAVMGVHNYFFIQAVDRYGNKKSTGGDRFTAFLEGPLASTSFVSDRGDGTFVGTYVAPSAGRYWLKVFYGNVPLAHTPISVVVRSNFDVCPNGCSGHGVCRDNLCVCEAGFAGLDCSIQTGNCPRNCMGNGACLNNTCYCYPGFAGAACESSTTLCPNDCSRHGECVDASCVCDEGYKGHDCSDNSGMCRGGCSGNGECVDGTCLCYPGFKGLACNERSKFCPKGCSGRGKCMDSGMCSCHEGWTGLDCSDKLRSSPWTSNIQHVSLQPSDLPAKLPRKTQ